MSATPFVRTNLGAFSENSGNVTYSSVESISDIEKYGWGIVSDDAIPILPSKIPVISCIGTSRDGKSTLLNLYTNWLCKQQISPFKAVDSDEVGTNGIDYYITNVKSDKSKNCMLVDCQGMQLKNARYDSHLMLLTYLMSNIIILTVRQRLDLQVLNNCLPTFSFLCEIPDEYKRKDSDKPILLIRIKDYQGFKQLKEDPDYLNKYVHEWLSKSDDQYDKIKEAFQLAFSIQIMATAHPKMNDDYEFDIHSPNFFEENRTFLAACETIYKASAGTSRPAVLSDTKRLKLLINSLQTNKEIDWKKFDFYQQITENEIRKYIQDALMKEQFIDKTILGEMNGSLGSYQKYHDRELLIETTKKDTLFGKFKDIPDDVKLSILSPIFESFEAIVSECRKINHTRAREIIQPHLTQYKNKFQSNTMFEYYHAKILEFFGSAKPPLIKLLDGIDLEIKEEILADINKEEIELKQKQKIINENNQQQRDKIVEQIKKYNPNKHLKKYIREYLDDSIRTRYAYNESVDSAFASCLAKISAEIKQIYVDNDITWHLNSDAEIISTPCKMNFDIESYLPKIDDAYTKLYWEIKEFLFTSMGIIKSASTGIVDLNINKSIKFINICCYNMKFQITEKCDENTGFYADLLATMPKGLYKHTISEKENLKIIKIECSPCYAVTDFAGQNLVFTNIVQSKFAEFLMLFLTTNKFDGYCNDLRLLENI